MSMGEELVPAPKPKLKVGGARNRKDIQKLRGLEMAAAAAVRMENGEYTRPGYTRNFVLDDEGNRVRDENGHLIQTWNKAELMRIVCYSALDHTEFVTEHPYFQEMVELYRLRRTDPSFRRGFSDVLLTTIADEATKNLLEALLYYPHQLTFEQNIKAIKLVLDAGLALKKMGKGQDDPAEKLLEGLPPDERDRQMEGYIAKLRREADKLEGERKAHRAADVEADAVYD